MSYLEQEINEQPGIIRRLITEQADSAAEIAQAIRDFDPTFVLIAARGTSDNAGRYAQYLLEIQAGLPVGLATPSVHTLYGTAPRLNRALVIGISQSGQSKDVRQVISDARRQGALTLGITNNPDSPLAGAAQYHLALLCGQEKSVAATKSYTAELTVIALLTTQLTAKSDLRDALQTLPDHVTETLKLCEAIPTWVERYRYMEQMAIIGRGYNYSTAFEISLKLKELCYIIAQEYSEADFRHGPIAVVEPGFPVLCVAPEGKTSDVLLDLIYHLKKRSSEALIISNTPPLRDLAAKFMPLPDNLPEWLSPICAVIPGQVFAMTLAQVKGYSLDEPRGLTKVTSTT